MRTLLTVERFKAGQRLERKQQWSRSFVRGLFDLLYVAHARLPEATAYECSDVLLQDRRIDGEYYETYRYPRQMKGTLALCQPGARHLQVPGTFRSERADAGLHPGGFALQFDKTTNQQTRGRDWGMAATFRRPSSVVRRQPKLGGTPCPPDVNPTSCSWESTPCERTT